MVMTLGLTAIHLQSRWNINLLRYPFAFIDLNHRPVLSRGVLCNQTMKRDKNIPLAVHERCHARRTSNISPPLSTQPKFSFVFRPESRDKYTRSKSPNMFNRKTIEVSTPAVTKANVLAQKPQRARTASMPGENRKVSEKKAKFVPGLLIFRSEGNCKAIIHLLSTGGLAVTTRFMAQLMTLINHLNPVTLSP